MHGKQSREAKIRSYLYLIPGGKKVTQKWVLEIRKAAISVGIAAFLIVFMR